MSDILGRIGTQRDVTPSTRYLCYYPAMQPVADGTVITDRSGKGNNGSFGAGLSAANAWATAGYFTTAASSADQYGVIANSIISQWNYATECLMIAFRGKIPAPASTLGVFGNATKGPRIRAITATNKIDISLIHDAGTIFMTASTASPCDGNEHSYCFYISKPDDRAYYFIDGVLDTTQASLAAGAAVTFSGTDKWWIGGQSATAGLTTQTRGWHIATKVGTLPGNYADIAKRLHNAPFIPMSHTEWPSS